MLHRFNRSYNGYEHGALSNGQEKASQKSLALADRILVGVQDTGDGMLNLHVFGNQDIFIDQTSQST